VRVASGSRVIMRPGIRRADAQDLFLAGRAATVQAVLHDVDGDVHLAVSPDQDPAAELQRSHGRFLYFAPDEVEPLGSGSESRADQGAGIPRPAGKAEEEPMAEPWATTTTPPGGMRGPSSRPGTPSQTLGPEGAAGRQQGGPAWAAVDERPEEETEWSHG